MSNIFPKIAFKFKNRNFKFKNSLNNNVQIWDVIRRKYVAFTPEEMVRQHVIHALIDDYKIPMGWIAVEKSLKYNGLNKRFDVIVFERAEYPYLLIECKSPDIQMGIGTVLQATTYAHEFSSKYIMITNGSHTSIASISDGHIKWLEDWDPAEILE